MTINNDNHVVGLLRYFFISLTALVLSGLVYKTIFVIYNYSLFAGLPVSDIGYALIWGVRFDLAAAALLTLVSCLILWFFLRFSSRKNPALLLLGFMLFVQLSLQTGDSIYFAEAGRHVSYEMRDALADASGLFMTAVTKHLGFVAVSYLFGFIVIFIALMLCRKVLTQSVSTAALSSLKFAHEIKLFIVLLISIILVRGGVTGVPQSVISAFKIGDAQQAIITMNGAYSVVYGVLNSKKEINRVNVVLPGNVDVNKVMRSLYPGVDVLNPHSRSQVPVNKYNLVFVLMEGWPADLMSSYGYDKATTPFFDSLKEKAFSPMGAISGGARTTEGIYAIFCSQQNPLGETVAQSSLQNNQYQCLPDILKQQGWHTAFFQGSHKETSGTGAFAQSLGFTESFAKEDMPTGRYKHNYWGAHDPDIYDFLLNKLDDMPQPFLIGINTNSTHDVRVPAGVKPFFGNKNRSQKRESVLHFADQSMKEFFEKIKDKPYYKNTVFVLVSDHTNGMHKSISAKYFIPGIIYSEGLVPVKKINRYVSQRDFSPTILDILGLPASQSFAGKSFLDDKQGVYIADYFDAGSIGWLNDKALVETSVTNPSEIKCYSIDSGLLDAVPVKCNEMYKKHSMESLVFTSYSQSLLFSGKTKLFNESFDK